MEKEQLKKEILDTLERNKYTSSFEDCNLGTLKNLLTHAIDEVKLYETLLELKDENKIACDGIKIGNNLAVSSWHLKSYQESLKDQFYNLAEKGQIEQLVVKYYKEINNIAYSDEFIADKNWDKVRNIQKDLIEALAKYFEIKIEENQELKKILK